MARKSSTAKSSSPAPRRARAAPKPAARKNAAAPSTKGRLTAKQSAFAEHFALHNDPAEAYRHAFDASKMKPDTIRGAAHRTLRNPKIAALVAVKQARVVKVAETKFDLSVERVLQEIAPIIFANPADYFEFGYQDVPEFEKKPVKDDDGRLTFIPVIDPLTGKQKIRREPFAYAKPSASLTPTQMKAITGATMTTSKSGDKTIEVKLGDKLRAAGIALQILSKPNGDAPGVTVNVAGAAQVVMPGQPLTEIGDKRAALRQFEEMRASLMLPKG